MTRSRFIVCALVCALFCPLASANSKKKAPKKKRPTPFTPIKDDPNLPRVLIIGDSISIAYTLPLREALKGKANVHRIPTNGGPTTRGVAEIDKWLGDGKWDVIHFNWGLHDLKYLGPKGENLANPNDSKNHQQVPIDKYEANLRKLVKRMKKTGAKLIWCSTTPVPEGAKGRVVGDSVKYNAAALKVMKDEKVAVNDLYAFTKPQLKKIIRPANVHFIPEGSKLMAGHNAKQILAVLKKKK